MLRDGELFIFEIVAIGRFPSHQWMPYTLAHMGSTNWTWLIISKKERQKDRGTERKKEGEEGRKEGTNKGEIKKKQ